uniref:Uncharacterized protein n=1 Tax=Arundo donax TaxID=35708 RepID=A0A0A9H6Y4_ARUDO
MPAPPIQSMSRTKGHMLAAQAVAARNRNAAR